MKKLFCLILVSLTLGSFCITQANEYVELYSLDGRTVSVLQDEKDKWIAVGWYNLPPVTVYSLNGKELIIPGEYIEAYEKVGWYKEPPATVYALDGRVKKVPVDSVEAYLNVGWYKEPPVAMIARDGRKIYVAAKDVEAYKKVGWFVFVHPSEYGAAYAKDIINIIEKYGKFENGGEKGLRYGVYVDFERDMVPELVLLHDMCVEVYRYSEGASSLIYTAKLGCRYGQTDVSYTFGLNDTAEVPYIITYHSENEWTEENIKIFTLNNGIPRVNNLFAKTTGIDEGIEIIYSSIDGVYVSGKQYLAERSKFDTGLVSVYASYWEERYSENLYKSWDFIWATPAELDTFLRQLGL